MGGLFVKGQGEAVAATVVAATAPVWPAERAVGVSSVSMSTLVSLKCAGWLPQDVVSSRSGTWVYIRA